MGLGMGRTQDSHSGCREGPTKPVPVFPLQITSALLQQSGFSPVPVTAALRVRTLVSMDTFVLWKPISTQENLCQSRGGGAAQLSF